MLVIYSWEGIKNLQHNKSSSSRFISSYVVLKRSHYQTASTNIISPSHLLFGRNEIFSFSWSYFSCVPAAIGLHSSSTEVFSFFPKYFPDPLNQMFLRKTTITTSWNYFITWSLIHVVLPKPATRHLGSTKTSAAFCFSWILLYIYN